MALIFCVLDVLQCILYLQFLEQLTMLCTLIFLAKDFQMYELAIGAAQIADTHSIHVYQKRTTKLYSQSNGLFYPNKVLILVIIRFKFKGNNFLQTFLLLWYF